MKINFRFNQRLTALENKYNDFKIKVHTKTDSDASDNLREKVRQFEIFKQNSLMQEYRNKRFYTANKRLAAVTHTANKRLFYFIQLIKNLQQQLIN